MSEKTQNQARKLANGEWHLLLSANVFLPVWLLSLTAVQATTLLASNYTYRVITLLGYFSRISQSVFMEFEIIASYMMA